MDKRVRTFVLATYGCACLVIHPAQVKITATSHLASRRRIFITLPQTSEQHNVRQWKANHSEGQSVYLLDPDDHKLEIHCGNLNTRLSSLQLEPYEGLEWL